MIQNHDKNIKRNIKTSEGEAETRTAVTIYPEDTNLDVIEKEAASKLLAHLIRIEKKMKRDDVWSPIQTESDTRFMPLPEWITLVMIPMDTKNLKNLLLPSNYRVGEMAAYEQRVGGFPNLSQGLMRLFEQYSEMLESLKRIE